MVVPSFEDIELLESGARVAETHNLLRACLFNLIVVSSDPARTAHLEELVRVITEKFPCKIIFIHQDPHAKTDFARQSTGVQVVGTYTNRVLCDVISIEASPNEYHKIPFLILPHIVPDLPVYMLLGHDPSLDTVTLPNLQKYASRILFDPDGVDNYTLFSQRILAEIQQVKCPIVDINWARTKAWRDALARAFNATDVLKQLALSNNIQISYVNTPDRQKSHSALQAVYLQAHLASRLNWQFLGVEKEEDFIRISYKYDHQSLTISLVPRDTEILPPGAIYSFEAMTQGDYHFLITHEMDSKLVKVHASNPERCEMPYTIFLSNFQNGPALVGEMLYQNVSGHYHEMLQYLAQNEWR